MKLLFLPLILLAQPLAVAANFAIRINCGNKGNFTDSDGNFWGDDAFVTTGQPSGYRNVGGTNALLYGSNRFFSKWKHEKPFQYDVPIPENGMVTVKLLFVETFFDVIGKRVFNVVVEDNEIATDLDVFETVGKNSLLTLTETVEVIDGKVTIEFIESEQNPFITGIEIVSAGTTPTTSAPITTTSFPTTPAPITTTPSPTKAPITTTTTAPTKAPITTTTTEPTAAPTKAPTTTEPTAAPTKAPTTSAPTKTPITTTTTAPTKTPTTSAPTKTPIATTSQPTRAPTLSTTGFSKRINSGGNTFIDPAGNSWEADGYWTSGEPSNPKSFADPDYEDLYGTNRFFSKWKHVKPFQYEVPLPTSSLVTVNLYFVETFHTAAGERVFDILVDGETIENDFDPYASGYANGGNGLAIVTATVPVYDGNITIEFRENNRNPFISAIEILYAGELPPSPSPTPGPIFDPLYINCGSFEYEAKDGTIWLADESFIGGDTFAKFANPIANTEDDRLYSTERNGGSGDFKYEIPVPVGVFDVTLHFAEIKFEFPNYRVFNIKVEDILYENFDIVKMGGDTWLVPVTIEVTGLIVSDGFIDIDFMAIDGKNVPKVSAISVSVQGPHYAHSVPDITGNLGYSGVDVDGDDFESVEVDATNSHTHFEGQSLGRWTWYENNEIIGEGEKIDLTLSVGEHNVMLEVEDTAGNTDALNTTVTVFEQGYPLLYSLNPDKGDVAGNTFVTIVGTALSTVTEIKFGSAILSAGEFTVVDDETIELNTPYYGVAVPAAVSVINSLGQSNFLNYDYQSDTPVDFEVAKLMDFTRPTALLFGPDLKLYVANSKGQIGKLTLNDDFTQVADSVISSPLPDNRKILGLAIDPLDTSENPTVYCGSSVFYHGGFEDSSGTSINGMIHAISGSNLDEVADIITGLPVSDLDHGINGLEFGENGELYFLSGSNTNGGIPGALSSTKLLDENYFSASAMVAHLGEPGFNGEITYDAPVQGSPITGSGPQGVEVFAPGLRNPFGITWHPNGYLYATDNGPNKGFGDMANDCGSNDYTPSVYGKDRLQLLERDNFYGHPNRKRGETDPRQCVYHPFNEPSNGGYTGPLMPLDSSSDGITVYEAAYFKGQMRGNLIISQYGAGLKRVILSSDGRSVIPQSIPEIPLAGTDGLTVTLAPNGYLIDARYPTSTMYYYKPIEAASSEMAIMSVFPGRGPLAGGSKLYIFGKNFSGSPTVTVGGNACPVISVTSSKIACTLPMGTLGRKDVKVTIGGASDTFSEGYKYITGVPAR